MKTGLRSGLAIAWFGCIATVCHAQVDARKRIVLANEDTPNQARSTKGWHLGKGIHSYNLAKDADLCVELRKVATDPTKPEALKVQTLITPPAGRSGTTIHFATNQEEEYHHQHFDGNTSAKLPEVFTAEAQASADSEKWKARRTLSMILVRKETVPGEALPDPRKLGGDRPNQLQEVLRSSDSAKLQKLYRECGTHFVSAVYYVKQVSLTFRVNDIEALSYEKTYAETHGDGTAYGVTFGGAATFSKEIGRALQEHRVEIELNYIGVADEDKLAKALAGALRVPVVNNDPSQTVKARLQSKAPFDFNKLTKHIIDVAFAAVSEPKASSYEIASYASIGVPAQPVDAWNPEKLGYFWAIQTDLKATRDAKKAAIEIVQGENDIRRSVLAPQDVRLLKEALSKGVFDAYIERLEKVSAACVDDYANVRGTCVGRDRPAILDSIPKSATQPRLAYLARVNGDNGQVVVPERAISDLLFYRLLEDKKSPAFNADPQLNDKTTRPDALPRQVLLQGKAIGPVDVVLRVSGRHLTEYRVRVIGRGLGGKADEYPRNTDDSFARTTVSGDSFDLVFAPFPQPLGEPVSLPIAKAKADAKATADAKAKADAYREAWIHALKTQPESAMTTVTAFRFSRGEYVRPPPPPPRRKKKDLLEQGWDFVAGGGVTGHVFKKITGNPNADLMVNPSKAIAEGLGFPAILVPPAGNPSISLPMTQNVLESALRPRQRTPGQQGYKYKEVFCGDVLLEVSEKLSANPWLYRIAVARWSDGVGSVNLVTPSLLRASWDSSAIPLPRQCY